MRLTLNALQAALNQKGYAPEIQKETDQVSFLFKSEKVEIIFFLKPFEDRLQLLAYLPIRFTEESAGEVARLLLRINCEIDRPGWGMTEQGQFIFYRAVIPCPKGDLNEETFEWFLENVPKACDHFFAIIHLVATGKKRYKELFL